MIYQMVKKLLLKNNNNFSNLINNDLHFRKIIKYSY